MKRFTMFTMIVAMIAMAFMFTSCGVSKESADRIQTKQSETAFDEAQRQIGFPNIVNWMQRKTLRDIYA